MAQGALTLKDLQLLMALGRSGSLTGAARKLAVDHSTAFRRLGRIERRLGVRLFERARDGYAPTLAGEAAIAAAVQVLGELNDLERRLAGQDLKPSGCVRVTTTDTLVDFLAPTFAAFRNSHPDIILEVVISAAFFTLTQREAEVAVRPTAEPDETLIGRKVGVVAYAVYGARTRFRALEADLQAAEWLGFEQGLSHLGAARWLADHVRPDRIVMRANSLIALRAAARAGLGLAILPCFLADAAPELVRVAEPISELATPLWLLTHPDLRRMARIRAFLDFAAANIAARRLVLEGTGPRAALPCTNSSIAGGRE
jgi:DNA-binding transcriptional LysR family regulator